MPGSLVYRRFQRFAQGCIPLLYTAEVAVPRPCSEVRVVLTASQITFDCLFRRFLHGIHREEGVGCKRLATNRV